MSDRVKTNSVFHNSPIKKHLTDFKYDTVYFGTPHKLSSLTMKLDDVLFVSPLKGIASIFAVRPQNISKYCSLIDKNGDTSFNRNYKEWNKNSTDYLKEVHVSIIGSNLSVKPTVEDVTGYVYELKLTPELKEHIWWGNNMGPQDFEVVLKDLDSVTFNDMKEINVKMYISAGKNTTVQESYQPDNTTGTAEVDDFEDKDPDDCYCESHGPYFGSIWGVMPRVVYESGDISSNGIDLDLLTSPETIELCKKYRNHGLPWFYYNAETRKEFGELPANIVDNYFKLIGILLTKNEIDYNTYKKYLDVLYKMHGIPSEACIKSTETIRNTSFSDGKKDSILKFGVSDGKLPYSDNVRLFHTSSTPNLTSLNPRFRSRKPGERIEALFPSPRVYFGYNAICSRLGGSIPIESVNEDYFKKSTDHLYEYVGPKDYITAIYKDPELRGGNAVYVETTHDLPVKEIKSFEEFKKGMRTVNESYVPLSEFDHFFQEAKLKSKARKELDDSDFALVYKDASGNKIRKYPINDEAHVKAAARMFPRGVPNKYRKEVAGKILRRAHKFGIDTEGWKSLNNAVNKD